MMTLKLCNCSDRPLGILESRIYVENNVPYQVLSFGCTNKNCSQYHKIRWRKYINLLDNSKTLEEEV